MENETYTERDYLSKRSKKKLIDMEKVYRLLDSGRSVEEVAKEFGVSKTTLHRRHKEYQAYVRMIKQELPPLPEEF